MEFTDEEKKAIEYAKELRGLFTYGVGLTYGDKEDEAFKVLLNLVNRMQQDLFIKTTMVQDMDEDVQNYYGEDNDTCLHCGEDDPAYCETCYQDLIAENMKLQTRIKELEGIEEAHRKMNGELITNLNMENLVLGKHKDGEFDMTSFNRRYR